MKLPTVSASFALSLDGRVLASAKFPAHFASARHRKHRLELLAECDAIMVGEDITEAGDMRLRLPSPLRAKRLRAGKKPEPLRVIFSKSGRVRRHPSFFRGGARVVVFTTKSMPAATLRWLEKVADVRVEPRAASVDPRRALRALARDYGIRSLLCEDAPEIFRSLVVAGLVRKLHLAFAPFVIGGEEASTLLGPASRALLPRSIPLRLQSFRPSGEEVFATYFFDSASGSH